MVVAIAEPQELFEEETLEQALGQLTLYGQFGLPVLSTGREHLRGWLSRQAVVRALVQAIERSQENVERGAVAAEFAVADPDREAHRPTNPLEGYTVV